MILLSLRSSHPSLLVLSHLVYSGPHDTVDPVGKIGRL